MIFEKKLWKKIDIKDPIGICAGNTNENILRVVRDMIEGRCDGGAFIMKVLKVLKYGHIIINQNGRPDFGSVDVEILILCMHITRNEPIIGIQLTNQKSRESNRIAYGKTDGVRVLMNSSEIETVNQGQKIIVTAMESTYTINKQFVAVNAKMFTGFGGCGYFIIGDMEYNKDVIFGMLEKMGNIKINKDESAARFNKLLGGVRAADPDIKHIGLLNIADLIQPEKILKRGMCVGRAETMNLLEPKCEIVEIRDTMNTPTITIENFIEMIITDYNIVISAFNSISEHYAETYDENKNLWKYIERGRISI